LSREKMPSFATTFPPAPEKTPKLGESRAKINRKMALLRLFHPPITLKKISTSQSGAEVGLTVATPDAGNK
jgi:hypothetical protein